MALICWTADLLAVDAADRGLFSGESELEPPLLLQTQTETAQSQA